MPYLTNKDLPANIRNVLPSAAQTIFRKAFNSAYKRYGRDEVRAFRIAWAVVKRSYYKTINGKWRKC